MNRLKRVVHFGRGTVEAGGCLYVGLLGLFIVGALLGIGIVIDHIFFGGGGPGP